MIWCVVTIVVVWCCLFESVCGGDRFVEIQIQQPALSRLFSKSGFGVENASLHFSSFSHIDTHFRRSPVTFTRQ